MNYREVIPLKQKPNWSVSLPGSKSITNRAFLCASLAEGRSRLYGALESDDTKVMIASLKKVGVKIKKNKNHIEIVGCGGNFKKGGRVTFDLHNAGTATRFLTAIMTLRPYTLDDLRIVHIKSTLELNNLLVSEGCRSYLENKSEVYLELENLELEFDTSGNLISLL